MDINFHDSEMPAVIIDEERTGDGYTYVHIGEWHFCVEDDLEERDGRWWDDAKTWITYARYLDQVKAERSL